MDRGMPDIRKIVAVVLVFLCLGLPSVLSAKSRRGADVIVILLDGRQVKGELIAVRNASLVLLSPAGPGKDGAVESIDIRDIHSVRVVKRSRAVTGLLIGAATGAIGGSIWGHSQAVDEEDELSTIGGAVGLGAAGALIGLIVGAAAGTDDKMVFAGQPEPVIGRALARLARVSRERSVPIPPSGPIIAGRPAERKPATGAAARPEKVREPRFKLTWAGTLHIRDAGPLLMSADGSFRFTGDDPGPTGPFPMDVRMSSERPQFSLGCVDLAYAWDSHWSAEIEFHALPGQDLYTLNEMEFTSTLDGNTYHSSYGLMESMRPTSILAGLVYRPAPPGFLRHHSQALELGIAAGPAFMRITQNAPLDDLSRTANNTTWTVRVRAAYDLYFGRVFCFGGFVEHRWLKAHVPEFSLTAARIFVDVNDPGAFFPLTTSTTIAGRTFDMGGFACGLRLGLRF